MRLATESHNGQLTGLHLVIETAAEAFVLDHFIQQTCANVSGVDKTTMTMSVRCVVEVQIQAGYSALIPKGGMSIIPAYPDHPAMKTTPPVIQSSSDRST